MKKTELIFIPSPGLSHLISTVETAKILLERDQRLCITVLIIKHSNHNLIDSYTQKFSPTSSTNSKLRFINLPSQENPPVSTFFEFIDNQKDHVSEIVSNLLENPSHNYKLAGLVLDMFCTSFIDVANEFNLPSYVFYTGGAGSLGLFLHLLELKYEHNRQLTDCKDSEVELSVPCFSKPVPVKVLPDVFVNKGPISNIILKNFKRIPEAKGIMVNTFQELEPFSVESFSNENKYPRIYPVGPILNLSGDDIDFGNGEIKKWLDGQRESSVIFICFGSMGSFEDAQIKEIAFALEKSEVHFLWSLRKPGEKGTIYVPTEYDDFQEVLPEGFLERIEGIGKVIGWAPQVAVLSHPAIGGFISHCGWNSILESMWFGVPMATFPLYAEQQLNAFELVKELSLAEEVRIDYKNEMMSGKPSEIVGSGEIEAAIMRLMKVENPVRIRVKEMKEKSRKALMEGGSSHNAQINFIENVMKNVS